LLSALLYIAVPVAPDNLLHVVVTYDGDYDGVWEGVGPGILVGVGKAGNETYSYTDANSQAAYIVQPGVWIARAFPKPTRPFYVWLCGDYIDVQKPEETLALRCYEKFFLRFPFLSH
jgi:hypothetical protein